MASRPSDEPSVRLLTHEDLDPVAGVLGRAFEADPVFRAILPSDAHRRRALPALFREWIRLLHLPHPATSWTTDDLAGAALWSPSGAWGVGLGSILRMGPRMLAAMGSRALPGLRVLHAIEAPHPRKPHVYLRVLGCEPERQGRGIGSRLLQPMLAQCDARGDAAYLESSNEKNVPLYRRHGFEVTGEVVTHLGPKVWLMWREPRMRS
jgi:ribosomal protein S18 acetylase RimI-like enzyme